MDARTWKTFEELNARLSRLDYLATETVVTTDNFDQDEFKELFITNKPPSDEQRRKLQQSVKSKEKELSDIFWESYELKKKLEALDSRQASLRESIRPLKNVLSPFRQLPEDMIREILIACLDVDNAPTMSNKSVPMVLTQISSDIRRIALSTPALWAAIHISIVGCTHPGYLEQGMEIMTRREEGIKEWLNRSANCPLSISVHVICQTYIFLGDGVVDILLDYRSRWQKVDFICPPEFFVRLLGSTNITETPLLQSAAFQNSDSFSHLSRTNAHVQYPWPRIDIKRPHLTRLTIRGSGAHNAIDHGTVRLANLTHLVLITVADGEINTTAPDRLIMILRRTSSLVSLNTNIFVDRPRLLNTSDLSLPYLKTLTLQHQLESYLDDREDGLLDVIRAPLLEALQYTRFSTLRHSIMAFLKRSTNLRELRVSEVSHDTIIPFLHFCPMLTILYIKRFMSGISGGNYQGKDESILSALVTTDSQDAVCPHLAYFCVRDTPMIVTPGTLRRFLKGKKGVSFTLELVHGHEHLYNEVKNEALRSDPKMHISILQRVVSYLSTGLRRSYMVENSDLLRIWGWPTSLFDRV